MVRSILRVILFALPLLFGGSAISQVPPHQPGTICFTPQFWCWLPYPVYPGTACFCATPYGPVRGVAG